MSYGVENIVRKREIACYKQFLPFFFRNVFHSFISLVRQNVALCGYGLTTLYKKPFENIVGKEENAGNQHFLLFPQRFLPFKNKFQLFSHIYFVVCKCFQFGPV